MNNLLTRAITAIIGVAIILSAIVYSEWTFFLLFLLISLISLFEFYKLGLASGRRPFIVWGLIQSALIFAASYYAFSSMADPLHYFIVLAFFSMIFVFAIFRKNRENIISCIAFSIMGLLYISLPMSLVNAIAYSEGAYAYPLVIGLLFSQWANDTGGYFAGKALGKHKLYQAISPNKTWEGSIGGVVLVLIVTYVISLIFDDLSTIQWMGLGLVIAVFGSIGDLAESLFKRNLAIKDSGNTIPGHGGFLDRFDGLLLALPFATLYIHLII
jgi:phosphatidate cytidylyltransferase